MADDYKFNHGDQVKDIITGFAGTITGRADYMTGCRQYLVVAQCKKDMTSTPASNWYDEDRLVFTKNPTKKMKSKNAGGPQDSPPGKS